jgi:hypothetical protein
MSDFDMWLADGVRRGWTMPAAPRWKRLPAIRHVRATVLGVRVGWHNERWRSLGMVPTGYDDWVIFGIWHGQELEP